MDTMQGFETGELDGADCKIIYCTDCLPPEHEKSATIMDPDSLATCYGCGCNVSPWP